MYRIDSFLLIFFASARVQILRPFLSDGLRMTTTVLGNGGDASG